MNHGATPSVQEAAVHSGETIPIDGLARLVTGTGAFAALGGALAWLVVRSQHAAERVTVPASAEWLPGHTVRGPITAFAEADAIGKATLMATGGKPYSELGEDDATAEMARDASLL